MKLYQLPCWCYTRNSILFVFVKDSYLKTCLFLLLLFSIGQDLIGQTLSFTTFDSLAYSSPDSALSYLSSLNKTNYSRKDQLDYSLKMAYALMRKSELSASADLLYAGLQDPFISELPLLKAKYYRVLGINQYFNQQKNEAFVSFYRGLTELKKEDENETRAAIYHSLGSMYVEDEKPDSAEYYLSKSIQIREKNHETNKSFLMLCYRVYASFLAEQKKYEEAKTIYLKTLDYARKTNDITLEASVFVNLIQLPSYHLSNKELEAQIEVLIEKISKHPSENAKMYTLAISSSVLKERGLSDKAYDLLANAYTLKNNIHDKALAEVIAQKQVEYETALVQAQNLALQQKSEIQELQIKQNRQEKVLLLLALIVVLIGATLYYFRLKNRQDKLAYETELETQRVQTQALLDGEEQEKRRISMELHDGVAQMLAGVHFYLEALKTSKKPDSKWVDVAIDILSKTVYEVRSLSHSLSVSKWADLSIEEALEEIKKFSSVEMSINSEREQYEFQSQEQKLGLIRILQELIKNSISHGKSKEIGIKLQGDSPSQLSILYSDNGSDFNPFDEIQAKGIGLKNIQTRMKFWGISCSYERTEEKNNCTLFLKNVS